MILQIIQGEMAKRDLSKYEVAMMVTKHMSSQTVYNFLDGSNDIGSGKVSHILRALGLSIAPLVSIGPGGIGNYTQNETFSPIQAGRRQHTKPDAGGLPDKKE